MRAHNRFVSAGIAMGMLAFLAVAGCTNAPSDTGPVPNRVETVDLGDYEVVETWPRPLR